MCKTLWGDIDKAMSCLGPAKHELVRPAYECLDLISNDMILYNIVILLYFGSGLVTQCFLLLLVRMILL